MQGPTTSTAIRKRQRFAHEYLIDLNAVAAYRRAGYRATGNGANVSACKLLQHPEVAAIVQAGQKKHLEHLEITADRVLQEWARIAFGDIRDLFDEGGALINPTKLTARVSAGISSIECTSRPGQGAVVTKVKREDKNKALEMLAKHLGILKDQPPPAQWNLDPATLAKMSTEDLERALKHAELVQNILAGKPA